MFFSFKSLCFRWKERVHIAVTVGAADGSYRDMLRTQARSPLRLIEKLCARVFWNSFATRLKPKEFAIRALRNSSNVHAIRARGQSGFVEAERKNKADHGALDPSP